MKDWCGRRAAAGIAAATLFLSTSAESQPPPQCSPAGPLVVLSGEVSTGDAKTYRVLPFEVLAGTTRIEVGYRWADKGGIPSTPITQTVFDLGLWDPPDYRSVENFRGWSGSRQGKLHAGQSPVFVQSDQASRSFTPGAIEPGVWHVELGIAAVGPLGATWAVEIRCSNPPTGPPPTPDPVDAGFVATKPGPAWFHGDFHMHGYHSNPSAPDPLSADGFVAQARAAQLDFLMITDYVVGRHWNELGIVQRTNPDLLIWPGREVITYFGHVNTHGETPGVLEYRHGFEDVDIKKDVQIPAKQISGVLFQVNHPTIFPGPLFQNFCRGCEFTLGDVIDWNLVDTIEVATGPTRAQSTDIGLPNLPLQVQNPFMLTAIDLWEDLLRKGFKITAVSGSDSKGVNPPEERSRVGYGSSATAVYASELSRAALGEAIRAGHAYVRARGVAGSPSLELVATTKDGHSGTFGDTLVADDATLHVKVTGGSGQVLRYVVNGLPVFHMPIFGDEFEYDFPIARIFPEGPLGTFWRIETLDQSSITTIGNPIFLRGAQ